MNCGISLGLVGALIIVPARFCGTSGVALAADPSFSCAEASSAVERAICAEPRIAGLDARLAARYTEALHVAPADATRMRDAQRKWQKERDAACIKAPAPAPCLDGYYRNRLQALAEEQRLRDETAGHPPTSADYRAFVGRWRIVGVTGGPDAGDVTAFETDDPRYMGLVLEAGQDALRWLNGTEDNTTAETCHNPSFTPAKAKMPLIAGWKVVTLTCRKSGYWTEFPVPLTLKASDIAEMEWGDGALFHLRRVATDAKIPPAPRSSGPPPLPPGALEVGADGRAYFLALQIAVSRHDREWLAAQEDVRVNRANGASHTYGSDETREAYEWIITPSVERAILAQNADQLGRSWRGVMVGDGEVWLEQHWTGSEWKWFIEAINQ